MLIIFIVFALLSWIVSAQLKRRFKKYSSISIGGDMSGAEVAQQMLNDNGIFDVQVLSSSGHLSDHYNPANKSVNLSGDVYNGRNVSAAAVSAHECGHAIQHAKGYAPLKIRSTLVPLQNVSAKVLNVIFIAMFAGAIALPSLIPFDIALIIIIICYSIFTLFSIITLPVELNASRRALLWLTNSGITTQHNHKQAKDALKWAAYTYLIATLSSLATLIYYIFLFVNRRN
ncbi:MAG: zinc metallopeptidase [Marinilabiliaceae bacterium]|nr:zinc metallopeptidase [Marinilabiliaceae bacterium]